MSSDSSAAVVCPLNPGLAWALRKWVILGNLPVRRQERSKGRCCLSCLSPMEQEHVSAARTPSSNAACGEGLGEVLVTHDEI